MPPDSDDGTNGRSPGERSRSRHEWRGSDDLERRLLATPAGAELAGRLGRKEFRGRLEKGLVEDGKSFLIDDDGTSPLTAEEYAERLRAVGLGGGPEVLERKPVPRPVPKPAFPDPVLRLPFSWAELPPVPEDLIKFHGWWSRFVAGADCWAELHGMASTEEVLRDARFRLRAALDEPQADTAAEKLKEAVECYPWLLLTPHVQLALMRAKYDVAFAGKAVPDFGVMAETEEEAKLAKERRRDAEHHARCLLDEMRLAVRAEGTWGRRHGTRSARAFSDDIDGAVRLLTKRYAEFAIERWGAERPTDDDAVAMGVYADLALGMWVQRRRTEPSTAAKEHVARDLGCDVRTVRRRLGEARGSGGTKKGNST